MTGVFVDFAARPSFATCSPLVLTGFVFELCSDSSGLDSSFSWGFTGADAAEFASSSPLFVFLSPDAAGSFPVVQPSCGPNDCGAPIASGNLVVDVDISVPTAGNGALSAGSG